MHDDPSPKAVGPSDDLDAPPTRAAPTRSVAEATSDAVDWNRLETLALAARERSHAPYSRFRVGAALLKRDGDVSVGCNVENRTYGLCVCAERTAVVQAVADGCREFLAIAVATDASPPAVPCGLCLETLSEFCRDLPIRSVNPEGERRDLTLRQLFPSPFEWSGPDGGSTA